MEVIMSVPIKIHLSKEEVIKMICERFKVRLEDDSEFSVQELPAADVTYDSCDKSDAS